MNSLSPIVRYKLLGHIIDVGAVFKTLFRSFDFDLSIGGEAGMGSCECTCLLLPKAEMTAVGSCKYPT